MPVHGTEEIYDELVAPYPACRVTLDDLDAGLYFTSGSIEATRVRDAAYTQIKVG